MRLATIRVSGQTRAVRVEDDHAVEVGHADLVELLGRPDWRDVAATADGRSHPVDELDYAPVVLRPEKIVCVGLNYGAHIREMGRDLPEYPTLFGKYHRALIGANDDIVLPAASTMLDWEAELGVVLGAALRHASVEQARAAIAGYTVVNDVTARDWQYRTPQWLQGKTFEATTPVGPWLVTADPGGQPSFGLSCEVDGKLVQQSNTGDLVFDPGQLLSYISSIVTLVPGDLIATGTPGGVGHARTPPMYLGEGALLVTQIDGVGRCANRCVLEKVGS
jgi:acylpyruvate hydrolase